MDLKDGSTNSHLQVIVSQEIKKQNPHLGYGATIVASGKVGTTPRGDVELRADDVQLIGKY